MNIFNYNISKSALVAVLGALLLGTSGCRENDLVVSEPAIEHSDRVTITGTLSIPSQSIVQSRGGLAETAHKDLKLTLLEFDMGLTPDLTTISNSYKAEITSVTTAVDNGVDVNFKVTLLHTESPKVLHLVVADDYVSISGFGSEASILPSLVVGTTNPEEDVNETEAYWGRVEFPKGYSELKEEDTEDGTRVYYDLLPEVRTKLTSVPVIRNFAMITVSVDESVTNFRLLGFEVVNIPTAGTVAPWNAASQSIPTLLKADGSMKDYTTLIAETNPYAGIMAPGALIRNQESDARTWNETNHPGLNTVQAVYMYEHPYESTRRTYLIVHGIYTATNGTETPGYYKLDIGDANVADLTFNYYNIIRNIHYNVRITEVLAAGMSTVAEAISRAPYNNLISATETSSMLNVSDGKNMLIVNDTNIIFTNTKPLKVMYRYIENVTSGGGNPNNDKARVVGLDDEESPVVESYNESTYTDAAGVEWVVLEITPKNPSNVVKTQDFSIVDGEGLGRVIHLVLRQPWEYVSLGTVNGEDVYATVAPGTDNLYSQVEPMNVSNEANKPLTVYFNLPDGLPESMFPLEFQLEALKQGIENNKVGNLIVSTGLSLFPEKEGQTVISYIKTVSYLEYCYKYKNDGSNDVDVSDSNRNTNHTVRCRFLTINQVASGDPAEIRIHNDYFSPDVSVRFQRVTLE